MATRLLIILVLLAAAFWLLRRLSQHGPRRDDTWPQHTTETDIVRCAHCGLHVPRPETVTGSDGKSYCSPDHQLQHEKS